MQKKHAITIKQFESGTVSIPDDEYIPHEDFSDLQIFGMLSGFKQVGHIKFFEGKKTGIILHSDFVDLLERE